YGVGAAGPPEADPARLRERLPPRARSAGCAQERFLSEPASVPESPYWSRKVSQVNSFCPSSLCASARPRSWRVGQIVSVHAINERGLLADHRTVTPVYAGTEPAARQDVCRQF